METTKDFRAQACGLAGIGWRVIEDLEPGDRITHLWGDVMGELEVRTDGDRRIGRFRWDLPGEGRSGRERLAQTSSLDALGLHVATASGAGIVLDRQYVVRATTWDCFVTAQHTCVRLDRQVSDSTVRRVFEDLLGRRHIDLDEAEQLFFAGRLSSPELRAMLHPLAGVAG